MTFDNQNNPDKRELPFSINQRRLDMTVGYVALLLPIMLGLVTLFTNTCYYASISHYYYSRIGGDILVGSLSFIGLLLIFVYNIKPGEDEGQLEYYDHDMWLIRIAGISAFMIAFSPTTGSGCLFDGSEVARVLITGATGSENFGNDLKNVAGTITYDFWASFFKDGSTSGLLGALRFVHLVGAAAMFLILGYISFFVFTRHNSSGSKYDSSGSKVVNSQKKIMRNKWYKCLGVALFVAVIAIGVKSLLVESSWILGDVQRKHLGIWWDGWHLTFVFEAIGLISFGLSWMIKGRFMDHFEDEYVLKQMR